MDAPLRSTLGWVSACCLALLLSACAALDAKRTETLQSVRTVGIISAFAETFHARKVGLTVYDSHLTKFPIASWGIDDAAEAKVRALVGKRYEVRPVTYHRAAIASEPPPGAIGAIRSHVSTKGLDAYILLRGEMFAGDKGRVIYRDSVVRGVGIVERIGMRYDVFAFYGIELLDGNFSYLGYSIARLPDSLISPPIRQVDQSFWPTSFDAASNQRLKAAIVDLIDETLPESLRRLQLLD